MHALVNAIRFIERCAVFAMFAPIVAFAQTHTEFPGTVMAKTNPSLRVCADPNDLPFSNHAEQGFENKLARMLAQALGKQVQFVWHMQGNGFLRDLYARRCDVVMGLPAADHAYGVLTTEPYYRSAYALVYRANAPYHLKSLDDPRLRTLRIGVHSMYGDKVDLPAGTTLAHRGIVKNVRGYDLFADYYRHANPSADLIKAVADRDVDVAIAWGPLAGYFATREPVKLTVVPLTHTHTILPFQFSISIAVRHGDTALRDKLNAFLKSHRAAIQTLLADYGVPQLNLNTVSLETNTHTTVAADR